MKICSAGHGKSVWNEFDANSQHYAFWGCPKYKELNCKAKQIDDTDEKFVNQVAYPNEQREVVKERDFEAEARGKVKHGFAIEAFKLGKPLNETTKLEIKDWVDFVFDN